MNRERVGQLSRRTFLGAACSCLAAEPEDRPRDAGEVTLAMRQFLDGVQERLHRSELDRVEAQARAEEEAKRAGCDEYFLKTDPLPKLRDKVRQYANARTAPPTG